MDIVAISTTPHAATQPRTSISGNEVFIVNGDGHLKAYSSRDAAVRMAFVCLDDRYEDTIQSLPFALRMGYARAKKNLDLDAACVILDDFVFSVEALTIDN